MVSLTLSYLHFNCQGLATDERLVEFENVIKITNFDIIDLSEIKRGREKDSRKEEMVIFSITI